MACSLIQITGQNHCATTQIAPALCPSLIAQLHLPRRRADSERSQKTARSRKTSALGLNAHSAAQLTAASFNPASNRSRLSPRPPLSPRDLFEPSAFQGIVIAISRDRDHWGTTERRRSRLTVFNPGSLVFLPCEQRTEMPTERLSMRQIREVLRLHYSVGMSQRTVARSLGLAQGTVSKYLTRWV